MIFFIFKTNLHIRVVFVFVLITFLCLYSCSSQSIEGQYQIDCRTEIANNIVNELSVFNFNDGKFFVNNLPDMYYNPYSNPEMTYQLKGDSLILNNGEKEEFIKFSIEDDTLYTIDSRKEEVYFRRVSQKLDCVGEVFPNSVGNRIYESESDLWYFTEDNRLNIIAKKDYIGLRKISFRKCQFYSIFDCNDKQYLKIYGVENPVFEFKFVNNQNIDLRVLDCGNESVKLKFVKDTTIERLLKSDILSYTDSSAVKNSYENYSQETLWKFTLLNNGEFKFQPEGHYNGGQLYMGTYEISNGVIKLNYYISDLGYLKKLFIEKLFIKEKELLITNKGMVFTSDTESQNSLEDLTDLLYSGLSEWKIRNKEALSNLSPQEFYSLEIISVNPDIKVGVLLTNRSEKSEQIVEILNLNDLEKLLE